MEPSNAASGPEGFVQGNSIEATPDNMLDLLLSGIPRIDGPFLSTEPGLGMPRIVLEFDVPPYLTEAPSCNGEPIPAPLTCKPLSWFLPTSTFLVLEARPCLPIIHDQVQGSYPSAEEREWLRLRTDSTLTSVNAVTLKWQCMTPLGQKYCRRTGRTLFSHRRPLHRPPPFTWLGGQPMGSVMPVIGRLVVAHLIGVKFE